MAVPLDQTMAGCVVLITADRRSAELASALKRRGATVRHAPAMGIVPHQHDEQLLLDTKRLLAEPPDTVIVTTGIGFRGWVEAADAAGIADELVSVLAASRIVARGPKARGAIQAAGLQADWVAESETSAEIADLLLGEGVAGQRIAVQHHGAGADGLDTGLAAAGAAVQSLVVYRWGPPPDPEALRSSVRQAAAGEIDAVAFTSAPGAQAWLEAADAAGVGPEVVRRFVDGGMVAAAVGPVTAQPLRARGISPLVPERGRLGALVRTLVGHYEEAATTAVATVAGALQVRSTVALLDGRVLPLSPSGLEVLRMLAQAKGEVVTRGQVLAALPGESLDPHAAEVAIARLRDAAGDRRLVQTVVKRGYRLARA
jgi:uroporphyrinogen-III synthase